MKQIFFTAFTTVFIMLSLNQATCNKKAGEADCIDKSKISNDPCAMDYDPVCGCDNKKYSNACMAEHAGVTRWTKGECK